MSRANVETVARRFMRVWTPGNLDLVDELAAPDIVVSYPHFPEPVQGRDGYREMLRQTFEVFPDIETTVEEVLVDGEKAVVRWSYHGTHQAGELYGLEATGREAEVSGITIYRIEAGRVVEETGIADVFGLMIQLGAVPTPRE